MQGVKLGLVALGAFPDAWAVRRITITSKSADGRGVPVGEGIREMAGETRFAVRSLGRSPGFTAMAVFTLALGIGANTAIFTVVSSVLLKPLGYPSADRIVLLRHPVPGLGEGTEWGLSVAAYFHFREHLSVLEDLGAARVTAMTVDGRDRPQRVESARVTASLFRVFGARAALGRLFLDSETVPGAESLAVLGHGLWTRTYGQDPDVIGSTIQVEGSAFEVIGVAEPGLGLPDHPIDLWLPARLDPTAPAYNNHYLSAFGLAGDGVTPERVEADMRRLVSRFDQVFPSAYSASFLQDFGFGAEVRTVRSDVVGSIEQRLWVVLAGVALVLLIACANVANLFMVRAEARRREVALRSALGAGRARLLRGFLSESLLLAFGAGALGVSIAMGLVRLLVRLAPETLPRVGEIALGADGAWFAIGVSVLAGVVFGSFPVLGFGSASALESLKDGGRGLVGHGSRGRARQVLVVGQVAMALLLLAASGLMFRSFRELRSVDPGFDPTGVLAVDISLPSSTYSDAQQVSDLYETLLTRISAFPEVVAAGAASRLPLTGYLGCWIVFSENGAQPKEEDACPPVLFVTPGYFAAMGVPVLEGREFEHADNREHTGAAILGRGLAESFWPGEPALDRGVRIYEDEPPFHHVVGVASDVRAEGLDRPATAIAYFPMMALPGTFQWGPARLMTLVVRTELSDPQALLGRVRATVEDLAPDAAFSEPRSLESMVARSMSRTTFTMLLLGIAAAIALVLGSVGIYGVISYTVAQRRAEVGVRMALGAPAGQVGRLILRQSMALAVLGVALGLVLAFGFRGVMSELLFGVGALDPVTLGGVAAILLAVAAAASYVPALRATRVDPANALRSE